MIDHEKCGRCGALGRDRRTLWMACLYDMSELGLTFEKRALRGAVVEKVTGQERHPWGSTSDVFSRTWPDPNVDRDNHLHVFYTLRVCKGCRGAWMTTIQDWFRAEPDTLVHWNNDETEAPEEMSRLLAKAEELRVEVAALRQQIDDTTESLRREHDRRRELNG